MITGAATMALAAPYLVIAGHPGPSPPEALSLAIGAVAVAAMLPPRADPA
jgi:hypothetical protein